MALTIPLTTLQDQQSSVRSAAASALGQLGQVDATVITALLTAFQDQQSSVRYAAASALGQLKVEEQHLLDQLLVGLTRRMHLLGDDKRQNALNVIDKQLEGRPLPDYVWIPIRARLERQRRINQFGWWAGVVCGLVLVALVVVYLSAQLEADNLLVRFGAAVALITGLAAGVAQVLGWTLHSPYKKHEP